MVLLGVLAAIVGGDVSAGALVWGALSGVSQGLGVWWFYAALGAGPISVVSPLTAVLVAALPIGVGLTMGERPGLIAAVGTGVALVAVVLVSREAADEPLARGDSNTDEDDHTHRFTKTVGWLTVGSGIGFGLNFVLIDQAPHEAGLWPLVFARVAATVLVVTIAAISGELRVPTGVPLKLAVLAGVLDTGANVAMLLALQSSLLSLSGVLMALYPAATVLLAIVVLRERVTRWQALGMVLALGAVAMIAAG